MKNKKIIFLISICYVFLTLILSKLLISNFNNLLNIVFSVIFISVILLFVFILFINFLERRFHLDILGSLDPKTKMTNRRVFNNCLIQLNNQQYHLISINLNNAFLKKKTKKVLIKELTSKINKQYIYALYLESYNKLYILTSNLNKIAQNLNKIYYIKKQKVNLLNNLQVIKNKNYI